MDDELKQFEREHGIVAWGGRLDASTLELAYKAGVFPWPMEPIDQMPLPWFCPPRRAVLYFKDLHQPKSLIRFLKKHTWRITVDKDFKQVIETCARLHEPTWITQPMLKAYIELHKRGGAHSVEVWEDETLVGGIYGVDAGGAFSCESMFHKKPNASKVALLHLISQLKMNGLDWIDIQQLSPHMEQLGAIEIARDRFLKELARTQALGLKLFA